MMELKFTEAKWQYDNSGCYLMLKGDAATVRQICEKIKPDKAYKADIKQDKNKRSNDQNALFWVLCGQLAARLGQKTEDVYRQLIKDIGNNFEVLPIKTESVDKFIEAWGHNGIGWVCDSLGDSKLLGYTNIVAYYGSSTYDKEQMKCLIDMLMYECEQAGISTENPSYAALLESN